MAAMTLEVIIKAALDDDERFLKLTDKEKQEILNSDSLEEAIRKLNEKDN